MTVRVAAEIGDAMSGRALKGRPSFYWSLGRDIVETQAENTYGSGFYVALSRNLRKEIQMPRDSRWEISGT